jgi:hypothetical protein
MRKGLLMMAGALALVTLFTAQAFARDIIVRGRLAKTVEAGGWLIVTGSEKYLLLNAPRHALGREGLLLRLQAAGNGRRETAVRRSAYGVSSGSHWR